MLIFCHSSNFESSKIDVVAYFLDEKLMQETETKLNILHESCMTPLEDSECAFWEDKVKTTLRPIPEGLTRTNELKHSLNNLRYAVLIGFFLINLIWILLFHMLTFEQLKVINVNPRVLIIVFLSIYGVILLIQFVTMIIHRFVTLAHYIARLNEKLPDEPVRTCMICCIDF